VYEELKDEGFEIVAVAQDTAGEAAAGPFYDAAEATFTTLIDRQHLVSSLYDMVNVPTGVLIDEEGRVVRFDEGAYSQTFQLGTMTIGTDEYRPIVADWVRKGAASELVFSPEEMAERLPRRDQGQLEADAHFRLASYLVAQGERDAAEAHWAEAQRLHPESWNYHRQDWSFTPAEAGPNWFRKFQGLEGKPYYAPIEKPGETPVERPGEPPP
jgi:hypothetical protein